MARIVLACSGGLNSSLAIRWLADRLASEIVTVTVDLGGGAELSAVRDRALALGASRAHVLDVRDAFARDYVRPSLVARATRAGAPLVTELAGALIARHLASIAQMEGTRTVAHACPFDTDDQLRIETPLRAIDPSLTVIAVGRLWQLPAEARVEQARQLGIDPAVDFGGGGTLWGRYVPPPDDDRVPPPEEAFRLTRPPVACPDAPAIVDLEFHGGLPTAINGVTMPFPELVASLDTIAGAHGVGRFDVVVPQRLGGTRRLVGEAPAAVVLHHALGALDALVLPGDLDTLAADLGHRYAALVAEGRWESTGRLAIEAFATAAHAHADGAVRLELFKGSCRTIGRSATPAARPQPFDEAAAEGFVRIWSQGAEGAPGPGIQAAAR